MSYQGHPLVALAWLINTALTIYLWIVIVSALLSWINPNPYNPIVQLLRSLTQPVYRIVHRYLPFLTIGGLDLSPIVIIVAIQMLKAVVVNSLVRVATG